jgi:hypothetical protein
MTLRTLLSAAALVALLSLPTAALADRGGHHGRGDGHSTQWRMEELLRLADEELASIDSLLEAADRPAVRKELHRKTEELAGILGRIRELGLELAAAPRETVVVERIVEVEAAPPPGPTACAPGEFERIVKSVQDQAFSEDQMRVLRSASADRWFTVDQLKRIMAVFSFSQQQIDSATLLHPRIVDRENWYQVYDALTFSSDKDELRKRVGE